jgi:hypothetical protein
LVVVLAVVLVVVLVVVLATFFEEAAAFGFPAPADFAPTFPRVESVSPFPDSSARFSAIEFDSLRSAAEFSTVGSGRFGWLLLARLLA